MCIQLYRVCQNDITQILALRVWLTFLVICTSNLYICTYDITWYAQCECPHSSPTSMECGHISSRGSEEGGEGVADCCRGPSWFQTSFTGMKNLLNRLVQILHVCLYFRCLVVTWKLFIHVCLCCRVYVVILTSCTMAMPSSPWGNTELISI